MGKDTPQERWRQRNLEYVRQKKREWRAANPEKVRAEYEARMKKHGEKEKARGRKYRTEHPDRVRTIKLRKFGIDIADYEAMLALQKGLCAICRRPNVEKRRLAVDHDHETKRVRGLLCGSCNKALGLFREDHRVVAAALDYLLHYQWAEFRRQAGLRPLPCVPGEDEFRKAAGLGKLGARGKDDG